MIINDKLIRKKVTKNNLSRISLFCFIILFVLRIPVLGFSIFIFSDNIVQSIEQYYGIGTYFFTALFIWMERGKLVNYHIDTISLLFFTLGPLWYFNSNLTFRIPMIIIGLLLLISFIKVKIKLPKIKIKTFGWILIGIIAGMAVGLISGYFRANQYTGIKVHAPFSVFITLFLTQLTNAAVYEEPFFRGILWGFLRNIKCKEINILLIQTGLFMLGHIYYINKVPTSFWIVVPLGGLVLGLLAWRSRSIATSMVAHGIVNGLGRFVIFYKF